MKKILIKITSVITLAVVFASCEDVVQIKLDEGSKLVVIDAFVNSLRQDQTIKITSNSSFFSSASPAGITTADVILYDLTANKQFAFTHTNNGTYVYNLLPSDTIAKVNHTYSLSIVIDGNLYSSTTIQKRPCSIDSIGTLLDDGAFGFGPPPTGPPKYFCILYAKDKVDSEPDFYWIKTFRNDTLFNAPGDINVNVDGTGGEVANAGADSVEFTPPSTFLGGKQYVKNDKCRVEVHSITRGTYNFFIQAGAQIQNGGLFATTPENVRTNISSSNDKAKAVGWFSVSTVVAKERVIN